MKNDFSFHIPFFLLKLLASFDFGAKLESSLLVFLYN